MKTLLTLAITLISGISLYAQASNYDRYFTSERLRIDLVLAGDADVQHAYLTELHKECEWAGSPASLIDEFGYGQYKLEAYHGKTLIYSHGFSTLFEEWQSTPQAHDIPMAFNQTIWMPFPKGCIHLKLSHRRYDDGLFEPLLEFDVDSKDRHIIPGSENDFPVEPLMLNGDKAHKVDLLFIAEGYTADKAAKFRADAIRFMDYMFTMEPYKSHREDFNVWLLGSYSQDGGVDIPQEGKWCKSVCGSGFDTFYEDRYLTVQDHRKIASVVSGVPFDTLFIIADDTKYGGGGIYNSYAMGTSGHRFSNAVFIHEFGHSFAGLGDEYYDSSVAYEDFYNLKVEPWEPNVTTLIDFASKWKDMIDDGTPVPTPNDKSYMGVVGLFEGAGYMAHGCFRPYFECRMLNNTAPGFCPVCQRAIERMIGFYTR